MKKIVVLIKYNYGTPSVYPACPESKFLAAMAGTKTLTSRHLDLIKKHGYSIKETHETVLR